MERLASALVQNEKLKKVVLECSSDNTIYIRFDRVSYWESFDLGHVSVNYVKAFIESIKPETPIEVQNV